MTTRESHRPNNAHSTELQQLLDEAAAFLARPARQRSAVTMLVPQSSGAGWRRRRRSGRGTTGPGSWRPLRLRPVKLQDVSRELVAAAGRRASVAPLLWVRRPSGRPIERTGGATILQLHRDLPTASVSRRGVTRAFAHRTVGGGGSALLQRPSKLHRPSTTASRLSRPSSVQHLTAAPAARPIPVAAVALRSTVPTPSIVAPSIVAPSIVKRLAAAKKKVPAGTDGHSSGMAGSVDDSDGTKLAPAKRRNQRRAMVLAGGVAAAVVAIVAITIGSRGSAPAPAADQGAGPSTQMAVVQTTGQDGRTTQATVTAPMTTVGGRLVAIVTGANGSTQQLAVQTVPPTATGAPIDSSRSTATTSAKVLVADTSRSAGNTASSSADQPAGTTPAPATAPEPTNHTGAVTGPDNGPATVVTGLTTLSGWILLTTPPAAAPTAQPPTTHSTTRGRATTSSAPGVPVFVPSTTSASLPPSTTPTEPTTAASAESTTSNATTASDATTAESTTTPPVPSTNDPVTSLTACVTVSVPPALGLPTCPAG